MNGRFGTISQEALVIICGNAGLTAPAIIPGGLNGKEQVMDITSGRNTVVKDIPDPSGDFRFCE